MDKKRTILPLSECLSIASPVFQRALAYEFSNTSMRRGYRNFKERKKERRGLTYPTLWWGAEKRTQIVSRRIDRRRRAQIFTMMGTIGESEGIMFELSTSFKNGHGGADR